MFRQLSLKSKLLLPVFTLIIILLFLGAMIIIFNYSKIISLGELNEKIIFSNVISNTLHSLQKERGLSSGHVSNLNSKFTQELLLQRKNSNENIKKLTASLEHISCKNFQKTTKEILSNIKTLHAIRKRVDHGDISTDTIIKKYSQINASLLNVIINIAKSSHVPTVTQNTLAYSHFLFIKEYSGIERAQGIAMFSSKEVHIDALIKFSNLIAIQEQNQEIFFKYASPQIQEYYNQVSQLEYFKKVKEIEYNILHQKKSYTHFDSKQWYNLMTKKLDSFDRVGKYIRIDTSEKIAKELRSAKKIFVLVITLTLFSLVVFLFMLVAFLKLIKEEQRLRVVMDKYIISSSTDLHGVITDVSQAFCDISGYSKSELIGQSHNIVRHPDMPKEAFKELWKKIKSGNSWRGKVKNRKKDGSFYWVYANVEPLYDSRGGIDSYISIRLDITENELLILKVQEEEQKNKVQEEFMQQQYRLAQMGEMISMIAHQWRQPLSAITAATGSINLKATLGKLDNQTAISLSDKIRDFSLHLSSTIDDFRNFFKSNKTKNETDYQQIIESVLLIIESSLKINNITLIKNIHTLQEFYTYENELKQVLLNLIKNAEDALLENRTSQPKITIEVDGLSLKVSDNAGGVSEEIINRIFEPYFSTKMKKDGTGLGLYMSKLIVEDHCCGTLSVTNENDGACFEIILGGDCD
jgi:PAS domain S-box-containing protein